MNASLHTEKPLASLGCLIEVVKAGVLSSSGTSVTASENTVTSKRQGRAYFTQAESSGNSVPVELIQEEASISVRYEISSSQSYFEKARNYGWNTIYGDVVSEKLTIRNGNVINRQKIDWGLAYNSSATPSDRCTIYCKSYSNTQVAILQVDRSVTDRFEIVQADIIDNNLQGTGQMWIKQNISGGATAMITFDINT